MGSLASRPKAPPQPQVIYIPQGSPATVSQNLPEPTEPKKEEPERNESAIRAAGLLSRERSRLGTIQTGFRGLLALAGKAGQRKTLLGE